MSQQQLARRETNAISVVAPTTFQEVMSFADKIADSDFVPKSMRGKPGAVLAAVQYGAELGLAPMQALNSLVVIHGNVGMKVELMLALILRHPELEKLDRTYDEDTMTATVVIKRRGQPERTVVFGKKHADRVSVTDDQKTVPLSQSGRYRAWPQRMYPARALGFAIRDEFPDVLKGIRTEEEVQSMGDGTVVDATPSGGALGEVVDAAWAWVPAEIRPTLAEAFGRCAIPVAKQRIVLYQFKERGHNALLEYLRDEYAARQGRERKPSTGPSESKPDAPTDVSPIAPKERKPTGPSETKVLDAHVVEDPGDAFHLTADDIDFGGDR